LSSEPDALPIVADERTGIVRNATREEAADLSDDDGVISEPSRLVANILWLVLVLTCSLVALASAAALLLDFLAPSQQVGGSKETILLLFSTAFNALVALFVTRPGTR
jgi:hypothetical protein